MSIQSEPISVNRARKLISETVRTLLPVVLDTDKSIARVLAEDIISPIDSPLFNSSTRDGYALRYEDIRISAPLRVEGTIKAGSYSGRPLKTGEAVRIYTGAPLPEGADTVVMQEYTDVKLNRLRITSKNICPGDYINKRGSQIKKGAVALKQGTALIPAAIGYLSALGVKKVRVYQQPCISIIITGDEFSNKNGSLKEGMIFESSSAMIAAALQYIHFKGASKIYYCKDHPARLLSLIRKVLPSSDMLITTGGVSAGKYDYLTKVFEKAGVKRLFHKIRQAPGKPLYFGKHNDKPVFGLPGNPASSLVCFYEYVYPAIRQMSGFSNTMPGILHLPVTAAFKKKRNMSRFLKASTDFNTVSILPNQESHYLNSFAQANCLVYLNDKVSGIKKGQAVEVHLIHLF